MNDEDIQKLVAVVEARSATAERQMERFVKAAEGRLGQFERSTAKTAARVEASMTGAFANITRSLKGFGTGLLAGAGVASISGIFGRIITAAERLDAVGDQAAKLGQSAGEYVQWSEALAMAGGESEAFAASAEDLIGKIGKLEGGIGKVKVIKQALEAIGSSPEALVNARSLQERLLLIADALQNIQSPEVRAAFADALGIRPMLPLLEKGRAGVQGLVADMKGIGDAAQLGVDVTGDLADRLAVLRKELDYKEDNLFVRLAPAIANVYTMLINLLKIWDDPRFKAIWSFTLGGAANSAAHALNDGRVETVSTVRQEIDRLRSQVADGWLGEEGTRETLAQIDMLQKLIPALQALEDARTAAGEASPTATSTSTISLLDGEAEAAAKAAEKFRALAAARADWRNDPEARYDSNQSLENASDSVSDALSRSTDAMSDRFDRDYADRNALKEDIKDVLHDGFATGDWDVVLRNKAADALGDAFDDAVDQLADALAGVLSDLKIGGGGGGGGLGGLVSGLIGSIFGNSGATGSSNVVAGILGLGRREYGGSARRGTPIIVGEKRPEIFVPNTSGHIIPRVPQAMGGRGGLSLTYAPSIDARGADTAAVAKLGLQLQQSQLQFRQFAAEEASRVRSIVNYGVDRRGIGR